MFISKCVYYIQQNKVEKFMSPLAQSCRTWLRLGSSLPDGGWLTKEHFGGSKEPHKEKRRRRRKQELKKKMPTKKNAARAGICDQNSRWPAFAAIALPHTNRGAPVGSPYLITRTQTQRLQPDLHAALLLRSSLQGAMEAACWEISAQQAMMNNYFTVNLLVLLFLSSSPVNQRKTHWGFNFY